MGNNKCKILTVGPPEPELTELLENEDYKVINTSYSDALFIFKSHIPDIVLLLLDVSSEERCCRLLSELRAESTVPIIVLSSVKSESTTVKLLDSGADDYIAKPYGEAELCARLRAALRSRRINSETYSGAEFFCRGGLKVNYNSRRVTVRGREIALTQNEYNILSFLTQNPDRALTYTEIIKAVWGDYPDSNSIKRLQVNISNIRGKLLPCNCIRNLAGVGYEIKDGDREN